MKDVYFDTSIISAIAKRDTPTETTAIVRILRADDAGQLRLFTSEVTQEEVAKYQGDAKPTVEAIYLLMKKANYVKRQEPLGMIITNRRGMSGLISPPIVDNPLWAELKALGLGDLDAHHLMVAVNQGCGVFLTTDGDFLTRKATIEARHNICVRRPSEFAVESGL
jgi:predicted nucleic acid-binding protein